MVLLLILSAKMYCVCCTFVHPHFSKHVVVTLNILYDMHMDFVTIIHDFPKQWFSKRHSLTSTKSIFSLFWAYFHYFKYIFSTFGELYGILQYLLHVRGFCSYVPHILTIIWTPNDYPIHHNHSFLLFCILSSVMLLCSLYQTFRLYCKINMWKLNTLKNITLYI